MIRIVLADDHSVMRSGLRALLQQHSDMQVVGEASDGREALNLVESLRPDVVVLDIWLPGLDGLTTLQRLRERQIDSQVVIISGHGNIESPVRAIKMGAYDFIEKPLSLEKTVLVVRNALRQRDLEAENRFLRAKVDFESEAHRRNYVFRIATNLVRDRYRRPRIDVAPLPDESQLQASGNLAVETQERSDLQRAMAQLKERGRDLLWLAYGQGSSHEEIAGSLGLKTGSIKPLLFRARRKLAGILKAQGSTRAQGSGLKAQG